MNNNIKIYQSQDNQIELNVKFETDTVWLTQAQMAELFQRNRVAITQHIGNIFKEGELDEISVSKEFLHTATEGKKYNTKYYNLDVIISVGYRVKSKQGTQFRQWATQRLRDYLVQGYAINQKRLEQKNQEIQHLKDGIKILLKTTHLLMAINASVRHVSYTFSNAITSYSKTINQLSITKP